MKKQKGININKEIEQARQSNYDLLYKYVKSIIVEQHMSDLALCVYMLDGTFDRMTKQKIDDMLQSGIVDKMFAVVNQPMDKIRE